MASLKEIKIRIASIRNTQKITAAMKMVSSAKLHHTQTVAERMLEYESRLKAILDGVLTDESDTNLPFTEQREVRQVAIVVFSSNTGLCGTFNANVWKELSANLSQYKTVGVQVRIFPVGKKIANELHKANLPTENDFIATGDNLSYEESARMATALSELFLSKQIDRVELLYHHFKSMGEQVLTKKTFLPVILPEKRSAEFTTDFIMEPSAPELLVLLIPKVLNLTIYTALLDTATAEHAARMLAMDTANDNANDLIRQLTLQYNKTRQQAITNELLDIMGGIGQK